MPISNVNTTDTFRTWFTRTNEIIARLNGNVVSDGVTVFGSFIIGANTNTSLSVANNFVVNSTSVLSSANTTFAANVTISSNALKLAVYANTVLFQPAGGTLFATDASVNANASVLGTLTANTLIATSDATLRANLTVNGSQTLVGALGMRQMLFTSTGAVDAPAALNNPQYDNYTDAGLEAAQVLNLNPGTNTVVTGIAAPTGVVGGRPLFVQNISATYKITLASANTSSSANNRFTTINNENIDIPPGAMLLLMWSSSLARWRVLAPPTSTATITTTGNASIGGNLTVAGTSGLTGNVNIGSNTLFVDTLNSRIGVGNTGASGYKFVVTGNSYFNGNTSVLGIFTVNGGLNSLADVWLANGAFTVNYSTSAGTVGGALTIGGVFTANNGSQSLIRNLWVSTLTIGATATCANLAVSGVSSFSANSTFSATTKITGASARLVIPVGSSLWAT